MRKKSIRFALLVILAVTSLSFLIESRLLPGLSQQRSVKGVLWIIQEAIKIIRDDYVEQPDPSRTMDGAYRGLVDSLDEFSTYLDTEMAARHRQSIDGNPFGVGLVLYKKFRTFPVVIGVRDNSPAAQKGIEIGDTVSSLDGRSTLILSMHEANLLLRDDSGSPLKIKILKASTDEEITLERQKIFDPLFNYTEIPETSGILTIHRLSPPCVQEITASVLPRLKTKNLPLIIDLRNCHEGDFKEMQKFANLFLQSSNIGYLENKAGKKEVLSCPSSPALDRFPLFVWTNQATMGAAEAAAAVLKEKKKATIIGFRTSGLVADQKFIPLEDGSGLLLSSAIFHLNAKKNIWGEGIEPDVKIEGMDQSQKAYLLKTQELLAGN